MVSRRHGARGCLVLREWASGQNKRPADPQPWWNATSGRVGVILPTESDHLTARWRAFARVGFSKTRPEVAFHRAQRRAALMNSFTFSRIACISLCVGGSLTVKPSRLTLFVFAEEFAAALLVAVVMAPVTASLTCALVGRSSIS